METVVESILLDDEEQCVVFVILVYNLWSDGSTYRQHTLTYDEWFKEGCYNG
jgi:hypothetical protein